MVCSGVRAFKTPTQLLLGTPRGSRKTKLPNLFTPDAFRKIIMRPPLKKLLRFLGKSFVYSLPSYLEEILFLLEADKVTSCENFVSLFANRFCKSLRNSSLCIYMLGVVNDFTNNL